MTEVPIIPSLKQVAPGHLSGLRTFETDGHGSENRVEEASELLCALLENVVALEGLAIRCSKPIIFEQCFPAILKHGPNLRWLTLRNHHSPLELDPEYHAIIQLKKLTALRSTYSNLTTLGIDVKLNLIDLQKTGHILTTTLALFRDLQELSLHTRMSYLTPTGYPIPVSLGASEGLVHPWVEELTSSKCGVELKSLRWLFDSKDARDKYGKHLDIRMFLQGTTLEYAFVRLGGSS